MYCKVFSRGSGKAAGIDYLMSLKDANGQMRFPPARLMRGDTAMTKRLIHDLKYAQRYTSGVLSWAEAPSNINGAILEEIMDSFQSMLSAGLEQDRLNWLWVMHQDKGRVELHWVVPNTDLHTGKRFAPYFDRVDRARFRAWERHTNATYLFADPSDPMRKRDLRIPSNLPRNKMDATEAIHSVISSLVKQQLIHNRDEIIQQLKNNGYKINRQGKDYISIQDKSGQKLRLRGAFYEVGFTNIQSLKSPVCKAVSPSIERIDELKLELERELKKRSNYISSRYQPIESNAQSVIDDLSGNLHLQPTATSKAAEGEISNDPIRKLSDSDDEEYGARKQQPLRRIDGSIIKFGRTTAIFCRSVQCAIDRIGRTIDQLRKTTANIYTY